MRIHLIAQDDSLEGLLPLEFLVKHNVLHHKFTSFKHGLRTFSSDTRVQAGDTIVCHGQVGQLGMAMQEIKPLNVIALCVPVESVDYEVQPMRLCHPGCKRTVLFSSNDLTNRGQWTDDLCDQYFDLPFIGHDVHAHAPLLTKFVETILNGGDVLSLYRETV